MARRPAKLGTHCLYAPKAFDVVNSTFLELIEEFQGAYDVIVNMFSPHSEGQAALTYMPYIEITRKIFRAAKIARPQYFINVGGAGSLELPEIEPHLCAADSGYFWRAYVFKMTGLRRRDLQFRQAFADSEAQIQYMEERLGPLGSGLRRLRNARLKARDGTASDEDVAFIKEYLQKAYDGDYSQTFVKAGRVTWLFFDGDTSWNWSFVSPPALYRPCRGGEEYHILEDLTPLKDTPDPRFYSGWYKDDPKDIEGRLRGISTVDFVRAVADDAESKFGLQKHWTAWTELEDDTPLPSYVTFEKGIKTREEYVTEA
ncbi:hypothetical protein LTS03_005627 [Exophiala xenobiotica]|nr:hypothetical protein LTR11_010102 [Exophiala xenobiotica]KAK5375073.1 hypothetical protein LTS03_005627 [Exophiala xenobiotica]KAK5401402.1 hypothetical protein LTR79_001921 [Exophiala xenobiotica]KAK5460233.1 hypothetical protein LTR20_007540 [Exophiala xenobiotica]